MSRGLVSGSAALLRPALIVALSGMAFLLAAELVGPIDKVLRRVMLAAALFSIAGLAMPPGAARRWRYLTWALCASPPVISPLLPQAGTAPDLVALLGVAFLVSHHAAPVARCALDAAAVSAALFLAYLYVPGVWHGATALAGFVSDGASVLAGAPRLTGPLHAGLWTSVFLLAFCGAGLARHLGALPLGVLAIAALAAPFCVAAMGSWFGFQLGAGLQVLFDPPGAYLVDQDQPRMTPPAVLASWTQFAVLVLLAPLAAAAGRDGAGISAPAWRVGPAGGAAAALMLAAGVFLTLVPPPDAERPAGRIGFLDRNLDFSVPEPGRYGLIQAGMFGSARDLLEQSGYSIARIDPEALEAELADLSVFVVINLQEHLSDAHVAAIWRFVENGGGLFVMGDHTDLFGLMAPTNALLEPVGVRFIFDSAYPLRRGFANGIELRPHPITVGVRDNGDMQIGTGGSLVLDKASVAPVIVGRYSFSDFGNRLNDGQGGLLGNYQHEHGEQLGDLVLAAATEYGKGRVLVFGDTTTYQVLAVPNAAYFAEQTFRFLSGHWDRNRSFAWIGLALAAAGALALAFSRGGGLGLTGGVGALALGTAAGLVLSPEPELPAPEAPERMALVDVRHIPRMPLRFFTEGAVGGFYTAIQRAGFLPIGDRRASGADLDRYGMAAYLDPAEPLSEDERQGLGRLLARGGTVVVAAGWPHRQGATDVLSLCGLRLDHVPLGPAKPEWQGQKVEFVDAWPLTAAAGVSMQPVLTWHDRAIVAETRIGAGRCVAFGDSRFFQDSYFEGEYDFHPINVRFIDAVLGQRDMQLAVEGRP